MIHLGNDTASSVNAEGGAIVRMVEKKDEELDFSKYLRMPERFATLNKIITRDLNGRYTTPTFTLYTKDDITRFLSNPYQYEDQLIAAVNYIYGASSHFRRLIQYFVGLNNFAYVVSPYKIDTAKANVRTTKNNYRRVLDLISSMNVRTQLPQILTVCLREDTFYGTFWISSDNVTIQRLPSEYCAISSIEGNVLNVTFDFSYFDTNSQYLAYYPPEFETRYNDYRNNRTTMRYQELSSPTSFAVKCNNDILDYSLPPFAGILREIYDLEDYKQLRMTKTELDNYAMIVMTLGMNDDGSYRLDYQKAVNFWRNLDGVLPPEIGSILTPMPVEKISFDRNTNQDDTTISDAEQNLFTAAGVSSLLFNNERASGNALLLSVKADQSLTYSIVKSIEDVINRLIQAQSYGKSFKVTFLDCSPFNQKELGDAYIKACQYGLPFISYYAASQGLAQDELDGMSFLENDVLGFVDRFKPLQSSATQSASTDSEAPTDEGGAPPKDMEDLSDSRELNQDYD